MTSNAKYALSYFLGIAFGGFLFVSLCLSRSAIPCISVIFFSGWFIHLISPTLRCVYACSVKKKTKTSNGANRYSKPPESNMASSSVSMKLLTRACPEKFGL